MSFEGGPSYREPIPSPEKQKTPEETQKEQGEKNFGKEGWKTLENAAKECNIPTDWILQEVSAHPEFQSELGDNIESCPDGLPKTLKEQYEKGVMSVKEEKVEANTQTKNIEDTKERIKTIESTREQIDKFYSLIPGGSTQLDKYLGVGSLKQWKEEAQKKRPDLKPDELEGFVLKEHRSEIVQAVSGKAGIDIAALEKSLDAIQIPSISRPDEAFKGSGVPKKYREAMEYGIIAPDGEKNPSVTVDIHGQRIRFSEGNDQYQTYEYDKLPPVKYIENKGLRIASPAEYEPRYRVEAHEQELYSENEALKLEIGAKGDKMDRLREQTIPALQEQLKNLEKGIFTPDTVSLLIEAHEILPGSGPELAQELAKSPGLASDKEFLRTHIQGLLGEIKEFDAKQIHQGEVLTELTHVKEEKKNRVGDYRNRVESSDKTARENLNTLVGYGFHHFGQGPLESILDKVNTDPGLYQSLGLTHPLDLGQSFSKNQSADRKVLAEVLSRLSGIPKNNLFQPDGFTLRSNAPDGKIIDDTYLVSAFERTGVIKAGIVGDVKVGEILRKKVEKKQENEI